VAALFRDVNYTPPPGRSHVTSTSGPSSPSQDKAQRSIDLAYDWLLGETLLRNPQQRQPMVHLCDGQEALWQARAEYLPDQNAVDILDLLHVTPRLWEAAKLLYGERSPLVVPFVRQRVTQYSKASRNGSPWPAASGYGAQVACGQEKVTLPHLPLPAQESPSHALPRVFGPRLSHRQWRD